MEQDCVNSADRAAVWEAAYRRLVKEAGGNLALGKLANRSRQGARKWRWKGVPVEHIETLENALGIPGYEINPVIFPKDKILQWAMQIISASHNARTPA